ncbi:MAG: response regulator [Paracoccaceae bacterium]|uniref:response regulator n=1 Tax=Seohaeicola saemankumensis TaxID=481181 RepID=UPI001E2A8BB3|nr:response regulator [Seohaeicola saemankumensis]MCD1624443.1 response regulator [Seohaeicola saemankumensis]
MEKLQRIMHVDDADDIRMIIKITLEMVGGYHVDQFASGQDAVDNAAGCTPQLFLLDFMMPDMDGMETWNALRTLSGFENIPAIFVTAKAEENFSQTMLDKGALAVITKPFDPMNICDQIEQAWAKFLTDATSAG